MHRIVAITMTFVVGMTVGAVEAAGGTMADVAKTTIYVTDASQIAALREIRQQYFTSNLPASTFVQVVSLARPEYLVEIEAIVAVK